MVYSHWYGGVAGNAVEDQIFWPLDNLLARYYTESITKMGSTLEFLAQDLEFEMIFVNL